MTPEVDQLQAEAKKKYPDTFAGLWRDNDRGSVIVLAFTRTPTLKRAVLERDFSRPDLIEEERPDIRCKSWNPLWSVLPATMISWSRKGYDSRTIGVDVRDNKVEIVLADVTPHSKSCCNTVRCRPHHGR